MKNPDPDFERLKDYDFADAKPAHTVQHLKKLQDLWAEEAQRRRVAVKRGEMSVKRLKDVLDKHGN